MILIKAVGLLLAAAAVGSATSLQDDPSAALRRLAASAKLAAQEYAIGVDDGVVVAEEEVAEAELFLAEAIRTSEALPISHRARAQAGLDSVLVLVRALDDPVLVAQRVDDLTASLARELGVVLDLVPVTVPSAADGEMVYRTECASCHGGSGAGDGPDGGSHIPPPADLTDRLGLADRSPLDFYRRVTIGVAGTAMPAFEDSLSEEDRWAVAVYSSGLRLPEPRGQVPPQFWLFETTARLSDEDLSNELSARGFEGSPAEIAAVRAHPGPLDDQSVTVATLARIRVQVDSAYDMAMAGEARSAESIALEAYMTFELVEPGLRSRAPGLASELEGAFATYRAAAGARRPPQELRTLRGGLIDRLTDAQEALGSAPSTWELFVQSFVILLREGVEAILIIGALIAFLVKTGAPGRRRDVYYGVVAALAASVLTAVLIETVFHMSVAQQELLEGATMLLATAVLFYVSYWLLSKMEVARWNRFVQGKIQQALVGGSVLALPTVAFLAVYREGFETVLFYKALFVSSGPSAGVPVAAGMLVATVALVLVYLGVSRFGVRIPLKPFFGVTGAFLYYMAFVFAGKGVLELQGAGVVGATYLSWAPVIPSLGMYGTAEGLILQSGLALLFAGGLIWTFVIEPRRLKVTSVLVPEPDEPSPGPAVSEVLNPERDLVRSLERMDADLAEVRAEISRIKDSVAEPSEPPTP